jgi:pyruvate dehydrogenase E1 component alpha subunit
MRKIYKQLVRHVKKQVKKVSGSSKGSSKGRSKKKSNKSIKKRIKKQSAPKRSNAKRSVSKESCGDYIFDPTTLQSTPFQILKEDGSITGQMPKLSDKQILQMYRWMVLARVFDARCIKLQRQGRMGTYASVLGQEADQVGSASALIDGDWLVPTFRENASCMVRGMKMKSLLQYWGGDERGHADKDAKNVLPISIPISTQDVHAVGIAMAMQYKKEKKAVLCHMGDGGTSEGDFHEALNFAGVFQAPVVFLATNNQWAISVPRTKQTHSETLAQKALAYGFTGVVVDGNDIFAIYKVVFDALEKARKGGGPTLIECITYRMGDHTTADDQKRYRSPKEVKKWEKKDPIARLKTYMEKKKLWDLTKERKLQDECVALVAAAVKAYEEEALPNPKDMFTHTFATLNEQLKEQQQDLIDTMGDKVEKKVLEKIEGGFP